MMLSFLWIIYEPEKGTPGESIMTDKFSIAEYHDRVASLAPALRERAGEAEKNRRLARQTVDELVAAGLFRVYQPGRFGGPELSMAEVLPLITRVARSCPATAWVLSIVQIHIWLVSLFPRQAQDDVFKDDADTLACGVLQPRAAAKRVAGGYELAQAQWPYASGCDFARWATMGGLVHSDGGPPEMWVFLLPGEEYDIIDDWHVTGLRGSGSKSLAIDGAFVPEHRAIRFADAISGELGKDRSALYRSSVLPILCLNLTGPPLGAACEAIEIFINHIEHRNLPFSIHKQVDSAQAHRLLGEAMLQTASAELMQERGAAMLRDSAEAGGQMPLVERNRVRVYSSGAVSQCVAAVESLYLESGGTALQETHPLQQLSRDIKAMALHAALVHENNLELWGASKLGKPLNSEFV